jgi:hypothetical protein
MSGAQSDSSQTGTHAQAGTLERLIERRC